MNLVFTDKISDVAFCDALEDSQVVKNWLLNRLTNYTNNLNKVTMEIGIDPWSKTEKPSFNWNIYWREIDSYGLTIGEECNHIINGGLIYRGDDNYSSHT